MWKREDVYKRQVHVMDACLKAGLNNVSFSTLPPAPSSGNVPNPQAS